VSDNLIYEYYDLPCFSVETRLLAEWLKNWNSIASKEERIFCSVKYPDLLWGPQSLLSNGYCSFFNIHIYTVHSFIDPIVQCRLDIELVIKRLDCKETIESTIWSMIRAWTCYSHPFSSNDKNMCSYTTVPSYVLMVWSLIMYRYNFVKYSGSIMWSLKKDDQKHRNLVLK
jgi:hypothetical protein